MRIDFKNLLFPQKNCVSLLSIHGCSHLWKQKELPQQCNRTTTTTTNITKSKTKHNKIVPFPAGMPNPRFKIDLVDPIITALQVDLSRCLLHQINSFTSRLWTYTLYYRLCLLKATKTIEDLRNRNKPVLRQQLSSFLSLNCHCEDSAPLQ